MRQIGSIRHTDQAVLNLWQGKKDSNLRMLESKSSALTNLAIPLHGQTAKRYLPINLVATADPWGEGFTVTTL